jgi:phenylacetate-CoA ligase
MTIRLECGQGLDPSRKPELELRIANRVKNEINVSPHVVIVDYCSLPRSERKSKRIFDNRPL